MESTVIEIIKQLIHFYFHFPDKDISFEGMRINMDIPYSSNIENDDPNSINVKRIELILPYGIFKSPDIEDIELNNNILRIENVLFLNSLVNVIDSHLFLLTSNPFSKKELYVPSINNLNKDREEHFNISICNSFIKDSLRRDKLFNKFAITSNKVLNYYQMNILNRPSFYSISIVRR